MRLMTDNRLKRLYMAYTGMGACVSGVLHFHEVKKLPMVTQASCLCIFEIMYLFEWSDYKACYFICSGLYEISK